MSEDRSGKGSGRHAEVNDDDGNLARSPATGRAPAAPKEAADGSHDRVEAEDLETQQSVAGEPSAAQLVKERALQSGGGRSSA